MNTTNNEQNENSPKTKDVDTKAMKQAYIEGARISDLAVQYGVDENYVSNVVVDEVEDDSVPEQPQPRPERKLSDAEVKNAREEYNRGKSINDIADELGVESHRVEAAVVDEPKADNLQTQEQISSKESKNKG